MALVIGTIIAFVFLEWPWRWLVIVPLALIEVFEIMLWLHWRGVRSVTGPEAIVGARGRTVTDCRPEGQVRVKGQLWRAHCAEGADSGEDVVVTKVSGLRLEVARR
jgi:membrane protein implicated in regulation of membrane protease activity